MLTTPLDPNESILMRRAFTVIELLVVLCVVGVVLALVVGAVGGGVSLSAPAKATVDGPLLLVGDSAILASQIVFVQRGYVWTARSGSNSINTHLPQEEVVAAWKEALQNERRVDEP